MYNATKAALIHLTKQLALELSPRVRVNCGRAGRGAHPAGRGAVEGPRAAGRSVHCAGPDREPDDVAAAVVFLASDAAAGSPARRW